MPWLCACLHPNISGDQSKKDRVTNAVHNAANELDNHSSRDFYAYGPNDHNWSLSNSDLNGPADRSKSEEIEYIRSVGSALEKGNNNNNVTVMPSDVWIIVDGYGIKCGYGRGGSCQ